MQGGTPHLICRFHDGMRLVLPTWMTDISSKAIAAIDYPRLPIANLQELSRLLDTTIASEASTIERDAENGNTTQVSNRPVRIESPICGV